MFFQRHRRAAAPPVGHGNRAITGAHRHRQVQGAGVGVTSALMRAISAGKCAKGTAPALMTARGLAMSAAMRSISGSSAAEPVSITASCGSAGQQPARQLGQPPGRLAPADRAGAGLQAQHALGRFYLARQPVIHQQPPWSPTGISIAQSVGAPPAKAAVASLCSDTVLEILPAQLWSAVAQ